MRLLACLAFLALSLLAHAQAAGGGYKVGDRVEILYDGKWYPGSVLEVGNNQWKVHYDGYDSGWDTWMPADRLRAGTAAADPGKPREPAAPVEPDMPVTGDPVVGEACEASWNNSWYWVRILKVDGGRYFIHWDGYGDEKDEWVTRDRLRRKGEAKDNLPRKGREGNGGGLAPEQMVGKEVEAYWRGRWYPATVVKTDGKLLRVRYVTTLKEGTQEEWVVKERVREKGAEAKYTVDPAKVPGKKGLSGLWYRTQYRVNFGMGEDIDPNKATGHGNKALTELVFFYPDGRVIQGEVPVDRSDAGFADWQASHPRNCGGYGIEGGLMHFEWGGDSEPAGASALETVNADRMKLNGVPLVRAREFRAGTKLEGEFLLIDTSEGTVRWVFRKDGTFECHKTLTIGRESRQTDLKGTYEFSGCDLFTWEGGKPSFKAIAFPLWEDGEPANHIYIDEGIHIRKQ